MYTEMINLNRNGNFIVASTVCDRKRIAFRKTYTVYTSYLGICKTDSSVGLSCNIVVISLVKCSKKLKMYLKYHSTNLKSNIPIKVNEIILRL